MTAEGWKRCWLGVAGVSGAMGVAFAAYARHASGNAAQAADWLETASRFQIYHAVALLAVAHLQAAGGKLARAAGILFTLGILLFCCSLYIMALLALPPLPTVPFGGTAFILGWLAVAACAFKRGNPPGI